VLTINSNLASLTAQRHLSSSQGELATSMKRLSSGLRVNSAKDDAAGLSIAERMNAQLRGMNVAVRNANDAISLAQTAEGALGQVSHALQRMRELTVQARNTTNADSDKDSLNKEFGELAKEITRVLGGTTFNGKAILGADAGSMTFQVGANTTGNDTIAITLDNLASAAQITAVAGAAAATSAQLAAANAAAKQAAIDTLTSQGYADVAATVAANYAPASSAAGAAQEYVRANMVHYAPTYDGVHLGIDAASTSAEAATLTRDRLIAAGWMVGDATTGATSVGIVAQATYEAFASAMPASSSGASIGSGTDAAALAQVVTDIDTALAYVNDQRATFGATQNRFESVIANLQIGVENQSAARSRIMDADFAAETANLSRSQILQQAGTAIVAQANQQPQAVLALLR